MAKVNKTVPKRQSQLSQDSIETYNNAQKQPTPDSLKNNRAYNRSVKGDDVKQFSIGLKDIDQTILFYFNNVIKPSVTQNAKRIPVPILYGSPERWASVQKDGFYRDKNGKIQTPLIMFKRDSVEKNRTLGNKLDANSPNNFGIFQKKFSKKNIYDRFSTLTTRIPVTELYGVIIPDYVNIVYSCIIFTEYVEQMNNIVESINFASDAYWGDPERFSFRAMIDTYTTTTEMNQGEDRTIKTSFNINMMGHVVPDTINASIGNMNKFYSKSSVKFGIETAGTQEILNARAKTPAKSAPKGRFYDGLLGTSITNINLVVAENVKDYLALNTLLETGVDQSVVSPSSKTVTFLGVQIADPPLNIPIPGVKDFQVYVNGIKIEGSAIDSITNENQDIRIKFNSNLEYPVTQEMSVVIIGKILTTQDIEQGTSSLLQSERQYLLLLTVLETGQDSATVDSLNNTITYHNVQIATTPPGFAELTIKDFQLFINGVKIEPSTVSNIQQQGQDIVVQFNSNLGYTITPEMNIVLIGKILRIQ